jgi:3-deoxy-D-manno-octulosonic-acid transferase
MALIMTTGTETGQAVARRHYLPLGATVCYFPLDLPWAVSQALEVLRPHIFATLESEIWPTFLSSARRRGVRLALLNARMSDRSFRRYERYGKYFIDFINLFEIIAPGSPQDYQRLAHLGIPSQKLHFTGNLKVDALLARRGAGQGTSPPPLPSGPGLGPGAFREQAPESDWAPPLNLRGEPVFLAASTHPGEEEVVLAAYEELRGPCPTLLLILAPRHPERAEEVGRLLAARGLGFQSWQRLKGGTEVRRQPVVLVDTVGDLFGLYRVAEVAFVGGSLVPHGGQNLLEAAAWGLAPLFGPYLQNFRWAEDILKEAGGGTMVRDAPSLAAAARLLLEDPEERRRQGAAALAALGPHQGAARRQAALIAALAES